MDSVTRPSAVPNSNRAENSDTAVLVLLCRGLKENSPTLDLADVSSWLTARQDDVEVHELEDICRKPGSIRSPLGRGGHRRLVLGLCSGDYPRVELQAHARSAGLDPLGLQTVNLGYCGETDTSLSTATTRAKTMLKSALARARVYPGSRPENTKAVLASANQKISRRSLFTLPPVSYVPVPTIDSATCTAGEGCDLCVSACLHRAMEKDAGSILVGRAHCQSCGVCIETCPQRAIEFPGWSAEEIEAQLCTLLDTRAGEPAPPVDFVCEKLTSNPRDESLPVPVRCISMISAASILQALGRGAPAVTARSCGDQCPTKIRDDVEGKADYCRQLLSVIGDQRAGERVKVVGIKDPTRTEVSSSPPPLLGASRDGPVKLFGLGVAADAVIRLADMYKIEDLEISHPFSPLGLVHIDQQACTGCGTCAGACPTRALNYVRDGNELVLTFEAALCIACGRCEPVCPEVESGAITVTRVTDVNRLRGGREVLFRSSEAVCVRCGAPIAARSVVERIAAVLGDNYIPEKMGRLCTGCRGMG